MPHGLVKKLSPANRVTLAPAADIHWPHTDPGLLEQWVKRIGQDHVYGLLVGDTFEFARTTVRKKMLGVLEDGSREEQESMVRDSILKLVHILEPVKHKILCAVEGNHGFQFSNDTTSEQQLCGELGIPYLNWMGFVRLNIPTRRSNRSGRILILYLHHSAGGAPRTLGTDVAGLLKADAVAVADIVMAGHTHECHGEVSRAYTITVQGEPRIILRERGYMRCGTLARRFEYEDVKGYKPKEAVGWCEVTITYTRGGSLDAERRHFQMRHPVREA
jgi:hypothetical protein